MVTKFICTFVVLLTHNMMLHCASAAVHSHNIDNVERESDGSYRARDSEHYVQSAHNTEFDHEAILGSVKEAEEYDRLSPEEAKKRLAKLLPKMDLNDDKRIDQVEMKKWILISFETLAREETVERMADVDDNRDGVVSWSEYLQDTFGVDFEEEVGAEDTGDTGMLIHEEKTMWTVADSNKDNVLDLAEFVVFSNPEEHKVMYPYLVEHTFREKDKNKDGRIDFQEFIGERGSQQDKEWLESERDKFEHELDTDKDGVLDNSEVRHWVVPDNEEVAEEEVEHLFSVADDNNDGLLSFEEILAHHDVFVGSEVTDYGNDLMGDHFEDEL